LEDAHDGFRKLAAFYRTRAQGGVSLMVTGGFSPDLRGRLHPFSGQLSHRWALGSHRRVTDAVHQEGSKIVLQLLHSGRYGFHPFIVSASNKRSPISSFTPRALTSDQIFRLIDDFSHSALLAKKAGYDGVEIMGSEGYLLHQFLSQRTNVRSDQWGGDFLNRMYFPLSVVSRIREQVGNDFLLIFRLSMLDLVEEGNTKEEVALLAKGLEQAGVNIINTGIGWHESRVPTIGSCVPRAGFSWVTKIFKSTVGIPLITGNRINTPEVAEKVLAEGHADMVSMARPFLADPNWVNKAKKGEREKLNRIFWCKPTLRKPMHSIIDES
jgi:2,4-dienoyl-CoA reductase (NADPH2)